MPRGIPNKKKVDTKNMSPAEYERTFGRKKPGPSVGFKRKKGPKVKAAKRGKVKDGYFMPGPGKSKPAYAAKKDGSPRAKPGPKPGFKRKKLTVPNGVTSGRMSAKKATLANAPKAEGKDLGTPPVKMTLGVIVQAALDLKEKDLKTLHARIEEKLAGDTSDLNKEDLDTVAELVNSGYSRLSALETVRKDRAMEAGQVAPEDEAGQQLTPPAPEEPAIEETSAEDGEEPDDEEEDGDDGDEEDEEDDKEEKGEEAAAAAR